LLLWRSGQSELILADRLLFGLRFAAGYREVRGASGRALILAGCSVLFVDRRQRRHQGEEVRRGLVAVLAARSIVQEGRSAARRVVLCARLPVVTLPGVSLIIFSASAGSRTSLVGLPFITLPSVARAGVSLIVLCASAGSRTSLVGSLLFPLPGVFLRSEEGLAGERDQEGKQEQHDEDRDEPAPSVHAASAPAGSGPSIHPFLPYAPVSPTEHSERPHPGRTMIWSS
jgi:hypothetical protein